MRIANKLFHALFVLVALIALLLTIALHPSLYKDWLQRQVRASTGYELTLGELELDLFPPHLSAGGVTLRNPQAAIDTPLLRLEHLAIDADPGQLFSGQRNWWRAALRDGELRAGQDERGRDLWQTDTRGSDETSASQGPPPRAAGSTRAPAALLRFQQIALENLRFIRLRVSASEAPDSEVLAVDVLRLERDSDERLRIKLRGEYAGEALRADGTLALPSSERARDVDFSASGFGGRLTITGRVGHDGIVPGEARYTVSWPQLDGLGRLSGRDLAALAPLDLTGSLAAPERGRWIVTTEGELGGERLSLDSALHHTGAAYRLQRLQLRYADSRLQGSGKLDSAAHSAEFHLDADLLNLDQLLALAPRGAGEEEQNRPATPLQQLSVWTLQLDARLQALRYGGYRLTDVDASVSSVDGELQVKAAVSGVRALQPAQDAARTEHAGAERSATGGDTSRRAVQWQIRRPLRAEGTLALADAAGSGGALQLSLRGEGVEADVRAQLPGQSWLPTKGSATLALHSLDGFSWPGSEQPQWRRLLPLQASLTAAREGAALRLDPIDIRVSHSDVGGSLVIDPSVEPLSVRGQLRSRKIDIDQFSTTSEEVLTDSAEELDEPSGDVIGDQPIDWSWLSALQGQLQLSVDSLNFNQTHFQDVQIDLHIEDGALSLDPLRAQLGDGGIRGNAHVARRADGAAVQARLIVTQLNPADLGRKNAGLIDGGYTDLLANFTTGGASPQALAAHLDGEFALEIQRATIRNRLFEVIGSDILTQLIDMINPFAQREETTELECAAAYFKAEDGVLTSPDQLAIETAKMKIRGGGEIDLRDETLKIDFVPTAR
ncbi:MAG: AsmA family protein [Halioglobus sp.]|nr:AsmA family protein [Halioglobus sp.]